MQKVPKNYILILFILGLRLCFNECNIANSFGFNAFGACLGLPMSGWAAWMYYDFYFSKKGQRKNGETKS